MEIVIYVLAVFFWMSGAVLVQSEMKGFRWLAALWPLLVWVAVYMTWRKR